MIIEKSEEQAKLEDGGTLRVNNDSEPWRF